MAAWEYEFYLRVLKVSLTSERSERVRDTFSMKFPHKRQFFLFIFETGKSGHLLQNACHRNVMKLGYKVIKEK